MDNNYSITVHNPLITDHSYKISKNIPYRRKFNLIAFLRQNRPLLERKRKYIYDTFNKVCDISQKCAVTKCGMSHEVLKGTKKDAYL